MPKTPDRFPGESDEEGLLLDDVWAGVDPTTVGEIRLVSGSLKGKDSIGVFNLRGGAATVSLEDFLLVVEPPAPSTTYTVTRTIGQVTQERWRRTAGLLNLKTIDYTYASGKVSTEIRKIYAVDGITITGQLTIVYTYTSGLVTSATYTRNI